MKFLQIGLGSMGKRRLRNLRFHKINPTHLAGFDVSEERSAAVAKEFGITTFTNFEQAIKVFQPDALVISTPPHLHAPYFLQAAKQNKHFFVEVGTSDDGFRQLLPLVKKMTAVAAPSCTYRYYEPVTLMKKIIESGKIGRVQAFTHHFGQYLPDWHPWEDYRKFYVSRPESSACREMVVFELQWLQWLIGAKVTSAVGMRDQSSDLELQIPDTYVASLKAGPHMLGTLMIEVIARAPFRTCRILGSEGVVEWEWQQRRVKLFTAEDKKWTTFKIKKGRQVKGYLTSTEEMYEQEMGAFLAAVTGKKPYPYTFQEEYDTLQILKQIESSNQV